MTFLERLSQHRFETLLLALLAAMVGFTLTGMQVPSQPVGSGLGRSLDVKRLQHLRRSKMLPVFHIDSALVDNVDAGTTAHIHLNAGQQLSLRGWAIDPSAHTAPRAVVFWIDKSTKPVQAALGVIRPDISELYKMSARDRSGFIAAIPTTGLAEGQHSLAIGIVDRCVKQISVARNVLRFDLARNVQGMDIATIDQVDGVAVDHSSDPARVTVAQNREAVISGWAIDSTGRFPAKGIIFGIDNHAFVPARYGLYRPDVASTMDNMALKNVGFSATVPSSLMTKGEHVLRVFLQPRMGKLEATSAALLVTAR